MAEIDQNDAELDHDQELENEFENELRNQLENTNEVEDEVPVNNIHPEEEPGYADDPDVGSGEKWPGWPGESVFRMLVPAQKVGSIIGRKGEYIKKTCEETKSRIKILDGPPGTRDRAVMVSAKEEPDSAVPPAIDGLLKVHQRVVEGLENESSHQPQGKMSTRLLVPAAQAGSLIGKLGATVKSIQEESNSIVRVLGTEDLPVFALPDDRIVEIVGEAASIHKAIELIASHLRKFLLDRSVIPVIEMLMQTRSSHVEHMPPPSQHWGLPPPPQSFPPNAPGGSGFGPSPHFMLPPRQYESFYPPSSDLPPEKQPHQGISAYGREAAPPMAMHMSSGQPAQSVITQVTAQMQIPLSYADAVIGTQGASVSYIRRVSGATVAIQETRGVPGEMTVEISGTASQVQTAQQLIQNFMAEAAAGVVASATPTQQHVTDQVVYNSYGTQGSVYATPPPPQQQQPPNNNNGSGQSGAGFSSVYGSGFGSY